MSDPSPNEPPRSPEPAGELKAELAAPRGAPATTSRARRRGRRVAIGLYYALIAAISTAAAVQISRQVFFAPALPPRFETCQEGLRALAAAVERARKAAPGTDGEEDAALGRFRSALEPEWGYRDQILLSCRGRADDERALDAIERLRYAEEHAVRREAGDLAPLRRRVQTIVENELGSGPSRSPEPPSAGDRR